MQSLSIKMVPATRTGAGGRATPTTARARGRGRAKEIPCRLSLVVAPAAASSSSPSPSSGGNEPDAKEEKAAADYRGSFLSRSQTYALLKQQMAVAAKFEVLTVCHPSLRSHVRVYLINDACGSADAHIFPNTRLTFLNLC